MGNALSLSPAHAGGSKSGEDILDFVAAEYILTMSPNDLTSLKSDEYCEKLFESISMAIEKVGGKKDLKQKYKEISDSSGKSISGSVATDEPSREKMAEEVATFYINVAKIYSSVVLAINPVFKYTTDGGETGYKPLKSKPDIPVGSSIELTKLSFCGSKINGLQEMDGTSVCQAHDPVYFSDSSTLEDRLKVPELRDFFCDSDYDIHSKQFTGLSPASQKCFDDNLTVFFHTFTGGKKEMPKNIKLFGHVPLNMYDKDGGDALSKCNEKPFDNILYGKEDGVVSSTTTTLVEKWAANLRDMVFDANKKQLELIDILNKCFIYEKPPEALAEVQYKSHVNVDKPIARIHPKLTSKEVSMTMHSMRKTLAEMYLSCEAKYLEGIKLYESIVESVSLSTIQNQISYMEQLKNTILYPIFGESGDSENSGKSEKSEKSDDSANK